MGIANFKSKFLNKKPAVRNPQLMHPDRDWAIGLFIAALIFLICGFWSIHVYFKNRAAAIPQIEDPAGVTVYRDSVVKEALKVIESRKKNFERLHSGLVPPTAAIEESATTTATTTPIEVEVVEQAEAIVQDPIVPTAEN